MKLNKDNYEFLMFELLEGNLNGNEKNALMEQISKDAFYQREWVLMQHTLVNPDSTIKMPHRDSMLRPEGRIIAFLSFKSFAKIAASLLLIVASVLWYNSLKTSRSVDQTNTGSLNSKEDAMTDNLKEGNTMVKQFPGEKRRSNRMTILAKKVPPLPVKPQNTNIDSVLPAIVPEMFFIKPIDKDGIAYSMGTNEVSGVDNPINNVRPNLEEQNKITKMLVQAEKIGNTMQEYLKDIPNLKFKVTPRIKDKRSIGIELKGETIYASALLEIK